MTRARVTCVRRCYMCGERVVSLSAHSGSRDCPACKRPTTLLPAFGSPSPRVEREFGSAMRA